MVKELPEVGFLNQLSQDNFERCSMREWMSNLRENNKKSSTYFNEDHLLRHIFQTKVYVIDQCLARM